MENRHLSKNVLLRFLFFNKSIFHPETKLLLSLRQGWIKKPKLFWNFYFILKAFSILKRSFYSAYNMLLVKSHMSHIFFIKSSFYFQTELLLCFLQTFKEVAPTIIQKAFLIFCFLLKAFQNLKGRNFYCVKKVFGKVAPTKKLIQDDSSERFIFSQFFSQSNLNWSFY